MMCNVHTKRRVLLLCGGRSGEHEVSLASAASVLDAAEDRIAFVVRVIARDGRLLSEDASRSALKAGRSDHLADDAASDRDLIRGLAALDGAAFDAVFPLLHGPNGEDGTVQGLLSVAGLPFVGSGVLGSAAAMDKPTMKRLFAEAGLPQVAWRAVAARDWRDAPASVTERLGDLPWPRFVKPANLGSSVGIGKARNEQEQAAALDEAFRHDRRAVVEQGLEGARELEVAVLGNDAPQATPPGEIRVVGDAFYDYEHKYSDGGAELIVPAELPRDVADTVRAMALAAFRAVDAAGLARVDFFVTRDGEGDGEGDGAVDGAVGGQVLVNEINTLPGFTSRSMYPLLWQAAGLPYPELIERLVELAIERHAPAPTEG